MGALSTRSWSAIPPCLLQPRSLGGASVFKAPDGLSVSRHPRLFLQRQLSILQLRSTCQSTAPWFPADSSPQHHLHPKSEMHPRPHICCSLSSHLQ